MEPEAATEVAGAASVGSLHWADWVVVVIYFVLVLAVGLLVSERAGKADWIRSALAGPLAC